MVWEKQIAAGQYRSGEKRRRAASYSAIDANMQRQTVIEELSRVAASKTPKSLTNNVTTSMGIRISRT